MSIEADLALTAEMALGAMNEGIYVTDLSRRIIYCWGGAAEQITGWPATAVMGRRYPDGVLCHIDKDGRRLCGEERCPLHRPIITGQSSQVPIIEAIENGLLTASDRIRFDDDLTFVDVRISSPVGTA